MSCSHELGVSSMVETVASLDYCFGVWLPSYYYFFFIPQNLLHFPVISPTLAVRTMKILALSSLHIHTLSYNSMILKTTTPLPLSSYSPATHQRISQVSWIGCTLNYPSSSLTWTASVHKPPTRCICFPQGVGLCTGTWGETLIKALLLCSIFWNLLSFGGRTESTSGTQSPTVTPDISIIFLWTILVIT